MNNIELFVKNKAELKIDQILGANMDFFRTGELLKDLIEDTITSWIKINIDAPLNSEAKELWKTLILNGKRIDEANCIISEFKEKFKN